LSFLDRLIYGLIGSVAGAAVGLLIAIFAEGWYVINSSRWAVFQTYVWICALIFGAWGFVKGADSGSVVGSMINTIYEQERASYTWWAGVLFILVVIAAWFWQ
jgi:hypothetical protein